MRILFVFSLWALIGAAADDDWAHWRGPTKTGVARGDAPLSWSDSSGVAWKADIPGRGFSSPVLWGNKIFLTTAIPTSAPPPEPAAPPPQPGERRRPRGAGTGIEHKFVVMCLDRDTGKVLWERVAATATPHEGYHNRYGSFASNSPVTDGKRVYASFGSRGLYAYDLNGKLAWQKEFPQMKILMTFGEGVAPALDGDVLYVKVDHEQGSFLVALDKNTGKELWKVDRDERTSWSEPVMIAHGGKKQLLVSASNKTIAYDPATGKALWSCGGLGSNVIPLPVVDDGVALVMSGHRSPKLMAIRLGGEGDLTGTDAVLWTNDRGNSYTPSPVLHEGKYYFVSDNGMLSCFDAKTGKPFYHQQRLPKAYNFKASPVAANGKLYLATEDEDVVVVKLGGEYEVLGTNTLAGQSFIASPAVSGGEIFLRGQNTLYCIRTK